MADVDARRLARQERADLAELLATLEPGQWLAPTLCAQWRVRDVVAHVICYDELSLRELAAIAARCSFRPAKVNAAVLERYGEHTAEQLVALLAAHREPRGVHAMLGGRVGLVETLVHHQDIRRGLGLPRSVPAERLAPALRMALIAPDIGGPWRVRGVRLVATDLPFSAGWGPEVRGPAEALLMAIAGRREVLGELSGPGRPRLAARISG